MKTRKSLFTPLSKVEMNEIRGGSRPRGGTIPLDEDILLPDPEPDDQQETT